VKLVYSLSWESPAFLWAIVSYSVGYKEGHREGYQRGKAVGRHISSQAVR